MLEDLSFLQEATLNHQGTENYIKAIEMTDKAIKLAGSDLEVLMDAYNLKGILLYRLGSLIESVNVLY